MPEENKYRLHTYSYMALRKAVGLIGIFLPFVLMLGVFLIFRTDVLQDSISHYYYTGMRDVFVGALCAVALFMFFYAGYDKLDNWLGHAAGLFALGVAWFPATEMGQADLTGIIHNISAALLFTIFAIFALFQFPKTNPDKDPTPEKLKRNTIYKISGVIIIVCIVVIAFYVWFIRQRYPIPQFIYWAETVALVAFGTTWLVKGEALLGDK